jgi:hypothetical protein
MTTSLKPIEDKILTEDLIDFITPNEGIILLTRAWVQYGDNVNDLKKTFRNTYIMLKKLLSKSDRMKSKILRNHLRKYLNLKVNEKSRDVLFFIPPNGDFGFSKVKREHIPYLESDLHLENLDALKVVLSQFDVKEDEWLNLNTKEEIIDYIIRNV